MGAWDLPWVIGASLGRCFLGASDGTIGVTGSRPFHIVLSSGFLRPWCTQVCTGSAGSEHGLPGKSDTTSDQSRQHTFCHGYTVSHSDRYICIYLNFASCLLSLNFYNMSI